MSSNSHNQPGKSGCTVGDKVNIGNASNPSLDENTGEKQVLGKDAEKYLREVASIEDVPDEQDQHDMDETIDKNKNS